MNRVSGNYLLVRPSWLADYSTRSEESTGVWSKKTRRAGERRDGCGERGRKLWKKVNRRERERGKAGEVRKLVRNGNERARTHTSLVWIKWERWTKRWKKKKGSQGAATRISCSLDTLTSGAGRVRKRVNRFMNVYMTTAINHTLYIPEAAGDDRKKWMNKQRQCCEGLEWES